MADNASITILRNTQANINAEPIKDGNILFTTDQPSNEIYADVGTKRIKIGGGKGISNISKTSTSGLVDTYTIAYNDGTTSTFEVTNGEGIQNLQIGGRNLYLGSREFKGIWSGKDKWNFLSEKYNGFRVASNKEAWNGLCQDVTVEAGDVYTISAYIKNTSETRFYASATGIIDKHGLVIDNSSDFRRVVITFTVKTGGVITPRFEESKGTTDGLQICGIKLERGNIATDWTPAPEDLETVAITNSEIDTILNS